MYDMNKVRREIIRSQMKFALHFPWLLPEGIRSNIFRRWNRCQRDLTIEAYDDDYRPQRPEAPLHLLDLSCTSGFGENVHPDVLYVPDGFGPGDWRYLMTCTPLPQGVEYFENPEFLVSMDGIDWRIPDGGASPVVGAPDNWIGYNSDPSLYLEDGELSLFYRDYRAYSGFAVVRLLVKKTHDAISWSAPETVLSYKRPVKDVAIIMSPTIVKLEGTYYMWYVWRDSAGRHHIYRMEAPNLTDWSNPKLVTIDGLPDKEEPWHPDVATASDGSLVRALCSFPLESPNNKRILICQDHCSNGLVWDFSGNVIERGSLNFGTKSLYRPSIVLNSPAPRLYYSGQDEQDHWQMACMDINL